MALLSVGVEGDCRGWLTKMFLLPMFSGAPEEGQVQRL